MPNSAREVERGVEQPRALLEVAERGAREALGVHRAGLDRVRAEPAGVAGGDAKPRRAASRMCPRSIRFLATRSPSARTLQLGLGRDQLERGLELGVALVVLVRMAQVAAQLGVQAGALDEVGVVRA